MKIGIPNGLLHNYYYPFWKTYFEKLDFEIITTSETTKAILDKGVNLSVAELCVPIKIYLGHVKELFDGDVDYIFVPRYVSIKKGQYFCPKFMGLPDMVKFTFPNISDKMISINIEEKSDGFSNYKNFKHLEKTFNISEKKNKNAIKEGMRELERFKAKCKEGYTAKEVIDEMHKNKVIPRRDDGEITIGVLGYVYNIYDPFISMDIINKLRQINVNVRTFEMLDDFKIEKELKELDKTLFWTFSDKILGAGYDFYKDEEIDGILHVTAFGCGPDSMLGKVLDIDSSEFKKPFMTIRIDEHSGENHLQTRIEAFVDMIRRKKHINN